ncbi:7374f33c-bc1a-40c4-943a-fd590564dcb6-CDS [Sclerotinia trifoliorum]|uniref:7374f33c-bc1a-40c4-943a-fd590564dcb6-CDS n=1 Tax=Sclerotinia trifoliorum TaxID=28548 RepID=A0A8H2VYB9_9HELO|nr:7374f33c-bc1a-40c4-943a-fd590564dcb6-CDS [Sclerotinia trifoliorum]
MGGRFNCATRNCNEPIILEYLLTYGAFVDNMSMKGVTPPMHAARTDHVRFANINVTSITDQMFLTPTITYNNHEVLELLLDRYTIQHMPKALIL